MTRFDAATPEDRRSLIAEALAAHRERESRFCTVEADGLPPAVADRGADADDAEDATPAWIQYSEREGQLNLDCTDEEYERVTAVLGDFPAFTVAAQDSPEDAEGRNIRVAARGDDERIARLVDRLFVEGFGYEDEVRLWATEL